MKFTAGLEAEDARLTYSPGDHGENRQPDGKKYNISETSSFHLSNSSLSVIYAQPGSESVTTNEQTSQNNIR